MLKSKFFWICAVALFLLITLFLYLYQTRATKANIIKVFIENKESFESIRQYAEDTEGKLYIYNISGTVVVSNKPDDGSLRAVDLEALPIKQDVKNIIFKLKYAGINEESGPYLQGVIVFSRTSGQEEQGIFYTNDDQTVYGQEIEKISDGWYYYWIGNV
ncbi:MAG TPA: hypothetical protein VHT96_18555 [Clostridia bacterium]|nr:hypothetical protein [Clostridia bacterium]